MANQNVTDIDSLPQMVRNKESRHLIDDAISAYRGDALRSAIISTWNAVVNDIIAKARELKILGDPEATKFVDRLDTYINDEKIGEMQRIERNILSTAEKRLMIITPQEHRMLKRIKEDRDMCAHPAFMKGNKLLFQPSPDLVRSHIVYALECLLIHIPLQGESVINKFKSDVTSISFPSNSDGVRKFISEKYLSRSKEFLVENMIIEILNIPFSSGNDDFFKMRRQLSWALSEISRRKPDTFARIAQTFIGQQTHVATQKNLLSICIFLGIEPRIWSWVTEPIRLNLLELINNSTASELIEHYVFDAYYISDLSQHLANKINSLDRLEQVQIISNHPYQEFISLAIHIYSQSQSFQEANFIGSTLISKLSPKFDKDAVVSLINNAVLKNGHVCHSWGTQEILVTVFDSTIRYLPHTRTHWKSLVDTMTKFNENNQGYITSLPQIRSRL